MSEWSRLCGDCKHFRLGHAALNQRLSTSEYGICIAGRHKNKCCCRDFYRKEPVSPTERIEKLETRLDELQQLIQDMRE